MQPMVQSQSVQIRMNGNVVNLDMLNNSSQFQSNHHLMHSLAMDLNNMQRHNEMIDELINNASEENGGLTSQQK